MDAKRENPCGYKNSLREVGAFYYGPMGIDLFSMQYRVGLPGLIRLGCVHASFRITNNRVLHFVILSEAKNLSSIDAKKERFFASLRITK
jgi:hypothetical protein